MTRFCYQLRKLDFQFDSDCIERMSKVSQAIHVHFFKCLIVLKMYLPGGESNPGLPRDRRGYLPLYYRGHKINDRTLFSINKEYAKNTIGHSGYNHLQTLAWLEPPWPNG